MNSNGVNSSFEKNDSKYIEKFSSIKIDGSVLSILDLEYEDQRKKYYPQGEFIKSINNIQSLELISPEYLMKGSYIDAYRLSIKGEFLASYMYHFSKDQKSEGMVWNSNSSENKKVERWMERQKKSCLLPNDKIFKWNY